MIRTLLLVVFMCGAAFLARHFTPTHYMADQHGSVSISSLVPKTFSDWTIDDSVPIVSADSSPNELANRIYAETLSRTYVNKRGVRIMLSISYGKDQSEALQVHTPEFCYPAQGFTIGPSSQSLIPMAGKPQPVVRLLAQAPGRYEPITYWVVMGNLVVNGGPSMRRNARFKYGFQGLIPDGVFFRVSSLGRDEAQQFHEQEIFLNDLFSVVSPDGRSRLAGVVSY